MGRYEEKEGCTRSSFLLCSLVWSSTHTHAHKDGVTMRLLSLADKPEAGGMNEEEREEDKAKDRGGKWMRRGAGWKDESK